MISNRVTFNTLVDYPRLEQLIKLLKKTPNQGLYAEVGVYKGGTARLIKETDPNRMLYLFDTFEGMPEVNQHDLHKKGDFADTSIEAIDALLQGFDNYAIYKGIFPNQNHEYVAHKQFAFVHLDVDIYTSVKECLEFFYPRMVKNGIIVLDDYNEPNCPGAKLAAGHFFASKPHKIIPTVQSQAIIILS